MFQDALNKSGYTYKLNFNPLEKQNTNKKKRSRKRDALWFNPPYNQAVKTNIGKEFLKLVDKCFPKTHPLAKIINRQTVKIGYSTTHNMQRIISGKKAKILRPNKPLEKSCNCREKSSCPLKEKCKGKKVIYKVTLEQEDGTTKTYIGSTSTSFKKRHAVHLHSFDHPEKTNIQTSLSNYIHELENRNTEFNLSWKILDRGMPFNPISEICDLCLKEKFHILKESNPNQLNSRNEIFSNCRHKHSLLLIPRDRKKKRMPG